MQDVGVPLEQTLAGLDHRLFEQRVAHRNSLRGKEREAHSATDHEGVDLRREGLDHRELVGDLGSAEHHRVRTLGVGGQLGQHRHLFGDEPTGVVREQLRHVVHRRLLAVDDTEAVGDESTVVADEFDQITGERLTLRLVLAGLTRVEADVLQQEDVTVGQALGAGQSILPDDIAGELDVAAEHLTELRRDGRERELRIRLALGAAEVGCDDDLGARFRECLDRRGGRDAPAGVGDRRAVQGDGGVGAHQHTAPLHPGVEQILQGLNCHCSGVLFGSVYQSDLPTRPMRSTTRFE